MKRLLVIICFVFPLAACGKNEMILFEEKEVAKYESPKEVTSNDVLQRAYQMASLQWTPLRAVPINDGAYFEPGATVQGIPYSSVKEINTYLFQDVSYHTFMTAVHNPNSVLYTDNISAYPYHGINCASYYGAVCSSSVMYALGFSIPYYANQIIQLPYMHRLESQIIDSLKVCDVLWKKGHVQMVFSTEFKADTLYSISTFESSGKNAHISHYSKEQFRAMWNAEGYVGYRYDNLIYSNKPIIFYPSEPIVYNNDLCPSKGDKAVYRTDDTITINIFNHNYDKIVLVNDNMIVSEDIFNGDSHMYTGLSEGIYFVYLQNGSEKSSPVSFETIKTDVNCSKNDAGQLYIRFGSKANVDYAAICTLSGDSVYFPISDIERTRGSILVPLINKSDYYYCKVIFKGNYGRIISRPIRVL